MPLTGCRYFTGYKPCGKASTCDELCAAQDIPRTHILIVHLGALGAVLRSTSLLPAIKRKFPSSQITWVTQQPADELLRNNPLIDRIYTTSTNDLLALKVLKFDIGFCIDKSLTAIGIINSTEVDLVYGFQAMSNGAIVPATPHAHRLWELGLDNHKKFFENTSSEQQLVHVALDLGPYLRDRYIYNFSPTELKEISTRRRTFLNKKKFIIGINTGCSGAIPYKKLTVATHRELIIQLQTRYNAAIVLLGGGREDHERNQEIARGLNVIASDCLQGLRDGAISVAACDIIISGDSLGMHMGIALGKWVIAWFGPTCAQEIDLYENGVKVLSSAPCAPCWKRQCEKPRMCYDQISLQEIITNIEDVARRIAIRLTEDVVGGSNS